MHILTVLGARPQFVKASAVSNVLRSHHREVLVHTGQHYDYYLSRVFFDELGIPEPDHELGVGSASHAVQTADMLQALGPLMERESPDLVLVYGDTNSTLAGALVAAKLGVRVAHVEAGLRSFNRAMPEEINREVTDHLSTFLFAPSEVAARQLVREGVTQGVHVVGDVMRDAVALHAERAKERSMYPEILGLSAKEYVACTVHRAENADDIVRLSGIVAALGRLELPVVWPLHPRTQRQLKEFNLRTAPNIRVIRPLSYLDMLQLVQSSAGLLTDSGGLQKEAYFLAVPCATLREETEWVETVEAGWNVLAGSDPDRIWDAVAHFDDARPAHPELYGNGDAAHRIVAVLSAHG